jgi:hypothetical protein
MLIHNGYARGFLPKYFAFILFKKDTCNLLALETDEPQLEYQFQIFMHTTPINEHEWGWGFQHCSKLDFHDDDEPWFNPGDYVFANKRSAFGSGLTLVWPGFPFLSRGDSWYCVC